MDVLKPCLFCPDGGKPERHSMEHFVGNPSNGIVETDHPKLSELFGIIGEKVVD